MPRLGNLALGLKVEVLPEARVPTTFSGWLEFRATRRGFDRISDLEPQSPPLPSRATPPADLTPAAVGRVRQWPPGRFASMACFFIPAQGVSGPTRCPPAASRARPTGFLAALTTVLAAKANISAARPRTRSPLGPPH